MMMARKKISDSKKKSSVPLEWTSNGALKTLMVFNKKIIAPKMTMNSFYNLFSRSTDLESAIRILSTNVWKWWYDFVNEDNESLFDTNRAEYNRLKSILEYWPWFAHTKARQIRDYHIAWSLFTNRLVNAFWQTIGFQVVDPRTVEIDVTATWDISWYTQTDLWFTTKSIPLDKEYIYMLTRSCDIDNEILWVSVVKTLYTDILSDLESIDHNYSYFKNGKIPAQLVILEDWVSDEQRVKVSEIMKEYYQGWKNHHKLGIMPWVKDIKKLEQSLSDMEFKTLREMTSIKISSATWVPKQLLWLNDSTFDNFDTAKRSFVEETVVPLENEFEAYYNNLLQNDLPEWYNFVIIKDHIDKFSDMIDNVVKWVNVGIITPNEWRELLGRSAIDDEMADKLQVSKSQQLLEDIDIATEVIWPETQ